MNGDLAHGGIAAHEGKAELEVFGIPMDPLSTVTALGDGIALLGTIIPS